MILFDYFTYGIFRFFCYIGKNEDDAKLLAVIGAGIFLGYVASTIYVVYLINNEVSMSVNAMKYESRRIWLWTWIVCSALCIIKYYWITPKKLRKINEKYKDFSVLKRTIIRWVLIFVFTFIPVSFFLICRYIEAKF